MPVINEVALLEQTIRVQEEAIASLRAQLAELEGRIKEAELYRDVWRSRLKHHLSRQEPAKDRLRKGQAKILVDELFDTLGPDQGLTITEIAEKADVSWSSVRNVLTKSEGRYQEKGERWYRSGFQLKLNNNGTHEVGPLETSSVG